MVGKPYWTIFWTEQSIEKWPATLVSSSEALWSNKCIFNFLLHSVTSSTDIFRGLSLVYLIYIPPSSKEFEMPYMPSLHFTIITTRNWSKVTGPKTPRGFHGALGDFLKENTGKLLSVFVVKQLWWENAGQICHSPPPPPPFPTCFDISDRLPLRQSANDSKPTFSNNSQEACRVQAYNNVDFTDWCLLVQE